ncbi:MAG TPA: MFS transporter [Nitrososphaeraceae archaeon]|nr:MFS transporter [Nitrososphaeraceae archaeon]
MNLQKEEKRVTSPWMTLAILSSLGIIAMSAETMILPAIPDFIEDLDISYEDSSWILAAFLVIGAVMTPIAGRLSDIYGKKKMLLIILGVYTLGLLLGALAANFFSIVIARAIQGIGISMFPISFGIIRDKFPPEKLAIAQGIFSSTLSGGAVIGLILGGSIIENFGWQATFLFVIPLAITLFIIISKFVYVREQEQHLVSNKASEFCCRFIHVRKDILLTENTTTTDSGSSNNNTDNRKRLSNSIDIKGAITLAVTIISFLITLQLLEKVGSNNLVEIIIFSILALVSLFLFIVIIEKKTPFPLIDFRLLTNKTIVYANIINMTVGITALMVVYQSIPILIRSPQPVGFGGNALEVANVQIPYLAISLIFSVTSGFVVSKFGNLRPTTLGTIISTIGFFILLLFHSTAASITAVLVLIAVGLALMQIGSVNVVLTSTPRRLSGISLGMNLLIYLIGSSAGPVIAGMYLQTNQVFVTSHGILTSFPSPESYNLIFLTAALIAAMSVVFAIFLNRNIQTVAEMPRK